MINKIHNFFTASFVILLLVYLFLIYNISYLGVYIHYTATPYITLTFFSAGSEPRHLKTNFAPDNLYQITALSRAVFVASAYVYILYYT